MSEKNIDVEGNITAGITDSHSWRVDKEHDTSGTSSYSNDGEMKRKLEDEGGGELLEEQDDTVVKKQKIGLMGFTQTFSIKSSVDKKGSLMPISIKLGAQKVKEPTPNLSRASASVAEMFNQDSDEEEMPPEAKMRMRNIGRDTPTSAGPNSFGKTRQGFCDIKKVFERNLKKQMDDANKN